MNKLGKFHLLKIPSFYYYNIIDSITAGTPEICASSWNRNSFPCFVNRLTDISGMHTCPLFIGIHFISLEKHPSQTVWITDDDFVKQMP